MLLHSPVELTDDVGLDFVCMFRATCEYIYMVCVRRCISSADGEAEYYGYVVLLYGVMVAARKRD